MSVLSTLFNGSMSRPNINFYHAKKPAAAVAYATTSTAQHRAPTVGLDNQVSTFGKAKDAAKFENFKEELGKHFSTQTWNNGAYAERAFETSKDPAYIKPTDPSLPTRFVKIKNMDVNIRSEEDPEYKSKAQRYKMLTTMFATEHREWKDNVNHCKSNKSRMFAILIQHCPKDLTQRLK